jgi:hypothetical protein
LTAAARGLPCLARVAGALVWTGRVSRAKPTEPDDLVALTLDHCTADESRVLEVLSQRESDAPFTRRSVRSLVRLYSPPPDALGGLVRLQLVQPWSGKNRYCPPAPVADVLRRRPRPDLPVRQRLAEAAGLTGVDASDVFVRRRGWSGADSDHVRPESAHLPLSLADHALSPSRRPRGLPPLGPGPP